VNNETEILLSSHLKKLVFHGVLILLSVNVYLKGEKYFLSNLKLEIHSLLVLILPKFSDF